MNFPHAGHLSPNTISLSAKKSRATSPPWGWTELTTVLPRTDPPVRLPPPCFPSVPTRSLCLPFPEEDEEVEDEDDDGQSDDDFDNELNENEQHFIKHVLAFFAACFTADTEILDVYGNEIRFDDLGEKLKNEHVYILIQVLTLTLVR